MNCHRNYPWYRDWSESFADRELVVVGIHTPETKAEHDTDKLLAQVQQEKLKFPVLVDNQYKNWHAWGNSVWPAVYLIDKQGYLRYWWFGELDWKDSGGHKIIKQRIEELLAEK